MNLLWLWIHAPFAAYRPLQAGSLRATSPVMTYSAAWGFLLNLAGIETRKGLERITTGIDSDAPLLEIALGLPDGLPGICSLFQQAHGYPIGTDASKNIARKCQGAKYHIAPVRREILVDLVMVIGARGEQNVLERVHQGICGKGDWPRYGLPFAGDNNLLFDRIDILDSVPECTWYVPVDIQSSLASSTARLAISIDRSDSSKTQTILVAPTGNRSSCPPKEAWHWTPRSPDSP